MAGPPPRRSNMSNAFFCCNFTAIQTNQKGLTDLFSSPKSLLKWLKFKSFINLYIKSLIVKRLLAATFQVSECVGITVMKPQSNYSYNMTCVEPCSIMTPLSKTQFIPFRSARVSLSECKHGGGTCRRARPTGGYVADQDLTVVADGVPQERRPTGSEGVLSVLGVKLCARSWYLFPTQRANLLEYSPGAFGISVRLG